MSWRTGSTIFIEMWPIIQKHIKDRDERVDFTSRLLELFAENDMDTFDVEDMHPDIRAAILKAGMEIGEPERYMDDEQKEEPKKSWWKR